MLVSEQASEKVLRISIDQAVQVPWPTWKTGADKSRRSSLESG